MTTGVTAVGHHARTDIITLISGHPSLRTTSLEDYLASNMTLYPPLVWPLLFTNVHTIALNLLVGARLHQFLKTWAALGHKYLQGRLYPPFLELANSNKVSNNRKWLCASGTLPYAKTSNRNTCIQNSKSLWLSSADFS